MHFTFITLHQNINEAIYLFNLILLSYSAGGGGDPLIITQ